MIGANKGPRPGEGYAAPTTQQPHPIRLIPFRKLPVSIMGRSDMSAMAKVVFTYLLDRQGRKVESWPSLDRIAVECGTSKPAVVRAIAELKHANVLAVRRPARGDRGRSNRYRIDIDAESNSATNRGAQRLRIVTHKCNVS
jgi:hypothetical protein